ncbi:hypothetical protein PSP31121_04738 [Pandoraea sputorum]|uniref:Uncharacterized protein n=1 Tax=Pandoraea sputorum TaxID=93222 RepID=A0A5E5BER0_9BURK|nr:hypothetical protein PSP31121_04738 [Pandoraea sputorum]
MTSLSATQAHLAPDPFDAMNAYPHAALRQFTLQPLGTEGFARAAVSGLDFGF